MLAKENSDNIEPCIHGESAGLSKDIVGLDTNQQSGGEALDQDKEYIIPDSRQQNTCQENEPGCLNATISQCRSGAQPKKRDRDVPCEDEAKAKDRSQYDLMLLEIGEESKSRQLGRQRQNELARQKFITALQDVCLPRTFRSEPAIRTQLQAEFIHLHYAKEGEDFFPSKLILLDTPDTASFSAATNALYLTQIASSSKDQKLLQNAMRSYQGALQVLRRDISKPKACQDDHIFGTIHIMSLCEAFTAISLDDRGRKQHTKGVELLFQGRGPESIKSVYMRVQLQQHQQQALLDGLICRKRSTVAKDPWLGVQKACHIKLTELTSLALRVPGALEDSDFLCSKGTFAPLDEIMDMLSDLKKLERILQTWMTSWYSDYDVLPYCRVPTSTLPWLKNIVDVDNGAFSSALQFPNPAFAKAHVLFWMPLLTLRQAIKGVAELHPFPLLATTGPVQKQQLLDGIEECAENLCMTALYLCSPLNGIDGFMEACGPLQLASMWYKKTQQSDKLAWCRNVFRSIEDRGIRAPIVGRSPRMPSCAAP